MPPADGARPPGDAPAAGAVVIGRNEGERLRICLRSLGSTARQVVYVDSGSTDGSVSLAAAMGAVVVELDPRIPFNAGRARAEGLRHLQALLPDLEYVQFVDGDSEIAAGWIAAATGFLEAHPDVAVVSGRLRERHPERSIYNRLCAIEWNVHPAGEARACGGNAMMRIAAVAAVGGYRSDLVGAEEPELCHRLRRAHWRIWRLPETIATHDAAMMHFGQWWRRNVRGGYSGLQVAWMCGGPPDFHGLRLVLSIWFWAACVPLLVLLLLPWLGGWALPVLAVYPLQIIRQVIRGGRRQDAWPDAAFSVLMKFPNLVGQVQCLLHWCLRRQAQPIEYKAVPRVPQHQPAGRLSAARLDESAAPSLRVGVLLDQPGQEAWVLEALGRALAVPDVRLGAVACIGAPPRGTAAALLHRFVDTVDGWLRCRREPLFGRVDVVEALRCGAALQVPVVWRRDGWRPDPAGTELLRASDVDVWLCFSAVAPCVPLPRVSRCGVWGLEIGLRSPATSPWAGATEIRAGSAVTMAQLVDYARPGFNALYRACGATIRNSARRNRLVTLCKAMNFFARELAVLARDGAAGQDGGGLRTPLPANYPPCARPSLRDVALLSCRLLARVAANRWRSLGYRDQWRIGYYYAEEAKELAPPPRDMRCLVPPRDRDWADPFIVEHEGRRVIFFEDLPCAAGKAHISAIEIRPDGEPGAPRAVLERPYHLSYPFVFGWEGELYMLPETAQNGTVELYRCEEFPGRWALHKVLLEGIRAFDATLVREQGRWWLFVNVAESGADPSEELHLYWSRSPFGPWQPHAANPVISDARRARGAGPLFRRDGRLYRPSQDCSETYGGAVSINRVDVLDTSRYEETPVNRVGPGRHADMRCLHTVGAAGRLRVVDFQVRRPKWSRV